jgi:MYXO-CTERM domain-containing protein
MAKSRFEMILSAIFAVLAVVTAIWPAWIESATRLEPDAGSGHTEWAIVGFFAILALAAALLARRQHRIASIARSEPT